LRNRPVTTTTDKKLNFLLGGYAYTGPENTDNPCEKGKYSMRNKKEGTLHTEIELIKTQLEVQGFVMTRLVNELYSNIGQMLSSTKMLIGITERKWNPPPKTLSEAHQTLSRAIEDLRGLCRPLNDDWLRNFRFPDTIAMEAERINLERPGLVDCTVDSFPDGLTSSVQLVLFGIVQEALANAVNHAAAKKISINVVNAKQNLELSIKDDGTGFTHPPSLFISKGMQSMRQRTVLLGGVAEWISHPGNGTTVIFRIPAKIIKQYTHGHNHSSS
jgi:signal transduction histidine kinase